MELSVCFLVLVLVVAVFCKLFAKFTMGMCRARRCLVGKTALVTGANGGMGFQIAMDFASRGCRVIMADVADMEASRKRIVQETGNDNLVLKKVDLASLQSVRELARDVVQEEDRLDLLINNAGCAGFNGVYTADGMLKVMQINHFGPFLLTHLLVDLLIKTPDSRIVFVASCMAYVHQLFSATNINSRPNIQLPLIHALVDYGNSKLCNVIATQILARKLKKHNVTCYSVYPGMVNTNIFNAGNENLKENASLFLKLRFTLFKLILSLYAKDPYEGAQTTLHCALAPASSLESGGFYWDCWSFWKPAAAKNERFCEDVWTECEKLVKLTEEEKLR